MSETDKLVERATRRGEVLSAMFPPDEIGSSFADRDGLWDSGTFARDALATIATLTAERTRMREANRLLAQKPMSFIAAILERTPNGEWIAVECRASKSRRPPRYRRTIRWVLP